jgi:putative FmdB family regulatory protein
VPIYEYRCTTCASEFEALVRKGSTPKCKSCGAATLERLFSLPAVKTETTQALGMRAAKKRDQKTAVDRVEAQRLYEKNHD